MQEKEWEVFILEAKRRYLGLTPISCPAFGNEKVYFNSVGFKHLIRKGRKLRDRDEQAKRLRLIHHAPNILTSSKKYLTHIISDPKSKDKIPAHFWSFVKIIEGIRITVIVRQLGKGQKHFLSIFSE